MKDKIKYINARGCPGGARGRPGAAVGGRDARETAGELFGDALSEQIGCNHCACAQKKGSRNSENSVNVSQRQPPVRAKLGPGPRPGTTLLHTPGTKMT